MEQKEQKFPRSALGLYVKFYCKRKNKSDTKYSSNLIEATRSWLALSQHEREIFTEQYEKYRKKFKRKFASYLKNAEPYLKKKDPHVRPRTREIAEKEPQYDNNMVDNTLFQQELGSVDECTSIYRTDSSYVSGLDIQQDTITVENVENEQDKTNFQEEVDLVLAEPTPPSIKNGQELFELLKQMEENDLSWSSLSEAQKRTYRAAVLSLKKDYLKNYKAYLESLPSNKLFEVYRLSA